MSKFLFAVGFLLSAVLFLLLSTYVEHSDAMANFYILSSITQGLAALLAIILTATLIIVQVFRRFAAWRIAMSFETISLVVAYSLGIISPLVFLRIGAQSWMLNASIALTGWCIIMLIPFLLHVGALFTNPIVLGDLEQDILEARNQKAYGKVSSLLQDFGYAWLHVVASRKQTEMKEFMDAWRNIGSHVMTSERVQSSFLNVVMKVSTKAVKKNYDDYAAEVYNSYHLFEELLQKMYPLYKRSSLELFKTAMKKDLRKIRECIIVRLRNRAFRCHHIGPQTEREKEPRALIRELLTLDPLLAREILPKPIGDRPVYELFASLLAEADALPDGPNTQY